MNIPLNIEFINNQNVYDLIKIIMIPIMLTLLISLVTMIISILFSEIPNQNITDNFIELNKKQLLRITGQKHKYKNKNELVEIARNKIKCKSL
jgi:hypothetical protein